MCYVYSEEKYHISYLLYPGHYKNISMDYMCLRLNNNEPLKSGKICILLDIRRRFGGRYLSQYISTRI